MKVISEQQLVTIIESIMRDKTQQAKRSGLPFNGISNSELFNEIGKRIEGDWSVERATSLKLTKDDLNAVAINRFYRKTGLSLLMMFAIVVLGLATLTTTFNIIPVFVYYGLLVVCVVVFVFVFAKKQREAKRDFWDGVGGSTKPDIEA